MAEPDYDPFRSIGPPDEGMLFRPIRPKAKGKSLPRIKRPVPPQPPEPPKPAAAPPAAKPVAENPAARPAVPPKPPAAPLPPPPTAARSSTQPPAPTQPQFAAAPSRPTPPPAARSSTQPAAAPTRPQPQPAAPAAKAPPPVAPRQPPAPRPGSGEVLGKARYATAAAAARRADLEKPARSLLADEMTPLQFLETLLQFGLYGDAVQFLAQAMRPLEAVIWGHTCLRQVLGNPDQPTADAVSVVGRWIVDRTEGNRRACRAAAEVVGLGSAAGCLCMAVFWSGGSIAPPDANPVAPREHLTGVAIGACLQLAAVTTEPHLAGDKLHTFAQQGVQIASGKPDE